MAYTISFVKSAKKTSIKHNNRNFSEKDWNTKYHKHIHREDTAMNRVIIQKDIRTMYSEIFDNAVEKYNSKQKRKNRKIKDYYTKVKRMKNMETQREFIIQIGQMEDYYSVFDNKKELSMWQTANKLLEDYVTDFEKRNPNLKIYNAIIHNDETTPHLHLNVIPVATGYKKGMEMRPSFDKALKQQKIDCSTEDNIYLNWRHQETDVIEKQMKELHLAREKVGSNNIKDIHQYKKAMQKVNAEIETVKKTFSTEIDTLKNNKQQEEHKLMRLKDNSISLKTEIDVLQRIALSRVTQEDIKVTNVPFKNKVIIDKKDFENLNDVYSKSQIIKKGEILSREKLREKDNKIERLENKNEHLNTVNNSLQKNNSEYREIISDKDKEIKDLRYKVSALEQQLEHTKELLSDVFSATKEYFQSNTIKFKQIIQNASIKAWDNMAEYSLKDVINKLTPKEKAIAEDVNAKTIEYLDNQEFERELEEEYEYY